MTDRDVRNIACLTTVGCITMTVVSICREIMYVKINGDTYTIGYDAELNRILITSTSNMTFKIDPQQWFRACYSYQYKIWIINER